MEKIKIKFGDEVYFNYITGNTTNSFELALINKTNKIIESYFYESKKELQVNFLNEIDKSSKNNSCEFDYIVMTDSKAHTQKVYDVKSKKLNDKGEF